MRVLRPLAALAIAVVILGAAALTIWRYEYPDLSPYDSLRMHPSQARPGEVSVTYAGVATLLFSDGYTSILIDGFFSRPSLSQVLFSRIAPDDAAIAAATAAMRIEELAAVFCVHSHYDHCMDSPAVALATGADLIGSETTAWIGRGMNMPENRIRVAPYGSSYEYGDFTITMLESRHVPLTWNASLIGSGLHEPLVPPARASAYLEGGSYSILIEHPLGSVLVQGSAGYVEGALDNLDVDVVLLGIGALGTKDDAYFDAYWNALVTATEPERLIPIHFEDFLLPVSAEQKPMSALTDDLPRTFSELRARTDADANLTLALLPYLEPVVLFSKN